jgi:hypothetical protein
MIGPCLVSLSDLFGVKFELLIGTPLGSASSEMLLVLRAEHCCPFVVPLLH